MKYTLNIDWLSLWCDFKFYAPTNLFKVVRLPYSTRQFKVVEEWFLDNELYCTVQTVPCSSVLKSTDGLIKLANRQLYVTGVFSDTLARLSRVGVSIRHISRLDICADFNEFLTHSNPECFIRDFLSGTILHSGRTKFTVSGEHDKCNTYSYLRIGQKSSSVHSYLYNKTKEMTEVKYKHYIADTWKENGLNTKNNVWRLEFTLDSQSTKFVDKDTGEISRIEITHLYDRIFLQNLFHSLLYDYFRFKVNDGLKNKSRMKDLILFPAEPSTLKVMRMPASSDAGRSDKILVRQLYQFELERRRLSSEEIIASRMLSAVLMKSEFLSEYVQKHANEWDNAHPK